MDAETSSREKTSLGRDLKISLKNQIAGVTKSKF